ncbi:DNA cytosine methyltransferase [Ureaplasma diversum]|uniref:DNA (cytosine-5-)-methyltransferase n=1 Tax=Ureaplasma diversum NCTC 246 TaxID=1188241 RepID=A0A084F0R1_9BACT|nr:DNA cytosine methyltransferase [Ureaplasma diversum]KEZ23803.1 Type II restriction modification system cytosine-5 DNA methyltransferase [Ureaplasma diversum NCTC 246]
MINNKPTYISLFSSAGVGCYGFKIEGFECIATNEIISRRLNIQKINQKCKFDSGYIAGNIKEQATKEQIYNEIKKWEKLGNDRVDVLIATPPCQGMSVANHKKSNNDIDRNSLIKESVDLIKTINPRIFVFENVAAFWKTGCVNKNKEIVEIGSMITDELKDQYLIHHQVINFKNYGSNSSRTRTLVIGVDRSYSNQVVPFELMPDYTKEKTLYDVVGHMKSLDWNQYDLNDFYHSFRTYPKHMLAWIKDLKQGESAFDNKDDNLKPHKIVDGKLVINKSKNADKYTRQIYSKVAPCVHTRNDQMASQNTIHPVDNRVFSIRELMQMMTIPNSFKWLDYDLAYLNQLSQEEKIKISKKEEMNIRQCIGEAVPTSIFKQIASKIKKVVSFSQLTHKQIKELIESHKLENTNNLKQFLYANKNQYSLSTLSMIIEYANSKRTKNSAYFTDKCIIQTIFNNLVDIDKEEISIIEPSVGSGNFLPFLFKKYANKKQVNLTVIDIDQDVLEMLKILYDDNNIPNNFKINFVCDDYMNFKHTKVDLIIGNPPFSKINGSYRANLLKTNYNKKATNLAEFFLEKAITNARYVSLIMPKTVLNTAEFKATRELLATKKVDSIIDFNESGFKGVLVETVNLIIDCGQKPSSTKVISTSLDLSINQKSKYIFDDTLPYWIIYRNDFFDNILKRMVFDVFNVFRDRQITNTNSSLIKTDKYNIRVLKSRNILDNGEILKIDGYDAYLDNETLSQLIVSKYIDNDSVYLTPNMTYKPRIIKKQKGYVVNGSVAILIPKDSGLKISKNQLEYISSQEFRDFYKIARNYQTRSLNIDETSCYWFGLKKEI